MGWILLIMLNIHIAIGFLCARIALDMRRKPEPWFFAGATLGVVGLVLLVAASLRKPIPETR